MASAESAKQRAIVTVLQERPWIAFGFLFALQLLCLFRQNPPHLTDDAAFFLRYAENIASGHGFRWNPEEAPVWGASAPLWPPLVAGGIALGLTSLQATLAISVSLTLASTLFLGLTVHRIFGSLGVFALAPLLSINSLYSSWATSGMESPLTFLLVACALYLACIQAGGIWFGVAAGLCMVHKIDLAPLGLVLLFGVAVWRREDFWKAAAVAASIAALWYGFATWYFGSPLPNSFMQKLGANYGDVSRTWVAGRALIDGAWEVRLPCMAIGLWCLRRRPFLAVVAFSVFAIPSVAYTIKPPPEQFQWYPAAMSGGVALLAACGLAHVLKVVGSGSSVTRSALALGGLVPLGLFLHFKEEPLVRMLHSNLEWTEPPRIAAGRWVDEHTPAEARLLTRWGNPAYASRRFVYDSSFLNRRPEEGDLFEKYKPEVFIDITRQPLSEYRPRIPYRIVQVFRPQARAIVVMVRSGVPLVGVHPSDLPNHDEPPEYWEMRELARRLLAGEAADVDFLDDRALRSLRSWVDAQRQKEEVHPIVEELELRLEELDQVEAER